MNMEKPDFILDRRSIRRFTDQKIDSKQIKAILTAATRFHSEKVRFKGWNNPYFQE